MGTGAKRSFNRSVAAATVALGMLSFPIAGMAHDRPVAMTVGMPTLPPPGWLEFCSTYRNVCDTKPSTAHEIVLSTESWDDLNRVNLSVNSQITPMSDMAHYGRVEWWRYPDDGAGACHSYALLKRWFLMQAGWPREALLMTVVLDQSGEGHAVLTVKTDKGDFVLDNLRSDIRLWSDTGYKYLMRQSQSDPNMWLPVERTSRAARRAEAARQSRQSQQPDLFTRLEKIETPVSVPPLPQHWKSWNTADAGLHLTTAALSQSGSGRLTASNIAGASGAQHMSVQSATVDVVDSVASANPLDLYVAVVNVAASVTADQALGSSVAAVKVADSIAADRALTSRPLPVNVFENAAVDEPPVQHLTALVKTLDKTGPDRGLRARSATVESSWSVQLLGNSSEAGALTSYHELQQTYSALLGPEQPRIVRSAVGGNAYWYRVRLAAESRENAEQLCDGLRAAGGSCLVQRD
jgi:predicted transglutaminase-like cysteine proteinase